MSMMSKMFKRKENIILEHWLEAPVEIIYIVVAYCRFPIELLHTFKEEECSRVDCIVILPSTPNINTRIVSGNVNSTLRIWDVDSGECLHILYGHSYAVRCVAIIPNDRIVSGSGDKTLRVWNADSGECLQVLKGHSDDVTCVDIMPDGRIVSGSKDATLRVWNADSGECLKVFNNISDSMYWITIMNNSRIIFESVDNTLIIWDVNLNAYNQLKGHLDVVNFVAIFPDGRFVSGSKDNTLKTWNINSSECLQTFNGHSDDVTCIALLQFQFHFVSGSRDNTLRVWNANGECKQILEGHTQVVFCVSTIPDINRDTIISGGGDKTLRIWNPYTGDCFQVIDDHPSYLYHIALTQDGRIVTGYDEETLKIWGET